VRPGGNGHLKIKENVQIENKTLGVLKINKNNFVFRKIQGIQILSLWNYLKYFI
jgi:hypothetical protein